MGLLVGYDVSDGVATLTMNSPPVNALGQGLRTELAESFLRAEADPVVEVVVLCSLGRTWPVGADIREFGKGNLPPSLPELCQQLARATKPVIAAIDGTALGGGLELALAACFRVASKEARFGFPEVLLGILPGAGGTQRLPRLIGAEHALRLMLSGSPVSASTALSIGLVDKVAEGDFVAAAQAMARDHIAGLRVLPTASSRKHSGAKDPAAYLAATSKARQVVRPSHDLVSARIIDCVEGALLLPADAGFTFERTAFAELLDTAQARALRHAFMAERRAAHSLPRVDSGKTLANVAILGGGAIGAGLAAALLRAGVRVTLIEVDKQSLSLALTRVARIQDAAVARGDIDTRTKEAEWGRLVASSNLGDVHGAELLIDTLPEEVHRRGLILAGLDGLLPREVPIFSVICDTDPLQLADASGRADRHLSLYLTEPVRHVTLVEIAGQNDVAPEAFGVLATLARILNWRLLRQGPIAGMMGQRFWTTQCDAADRCFAAGAAPHEVDRALRGFGLPFGPYEKRDIYGLDHLLCSRPVRRPGVSADPLGLTLAEWLMEQGRIGRRVGKGYHLYQETQRAPQGDPEVIAAADRVRPRAKLMGTQITRMLVGALANDGAWAIMEGRVRQPSDYDLVGLAQGFPRWRGGPMQMADETGLLSFRNDLVAWADESGSNFWEPAPLWDELIRNGRRFGSLNSD